MKKITLKKSDILSGGINAIRRAVDCFPDECVISIEKGDYFFGFEDTKPAYYPISNTFCKETRDTFFQIKDLSNVEIDFCGSNLVFSGWSMPFAVTGGKNVTLKNFTIDYSIPSNAEGEVVSVENDRFRVKLDPESFPFFIENGNLFFHDKSYTSKCWSIFEFERDSLCVRGENAEKYRNMELFYTDRPDVIEVKSTPDVMPKIGNIFVFRHGDRTHCGIFAQNSEELTFENISVYNSCGIAVVCQFCDTLKFRNVSVIPNLNKNRKVLSSHDDGIQISNCRGLVTIEGCRFRGLMDDAINIHGTSALVEKTEGKTIFGRFAEGCSTEFDRFAKSGDTIGFIERPTLNTLLKNTAVSYRLTDRDHFEITLENEPEVNSDTPLALENLTNNPEVIVKNCLFDMGRARGLLIGTNKRAVIKGNIFNTSGSAILSSGDANGWFESGSCRDITITDNYFSENCLSGEYQFGEAIISFYPVVDDKKRCNGFHGNVKIENNKFVTRNKTIGYFTCTNDIKITDNTIIQSTRSSGKLPCLFVYDTCNSITEENNSIYGPTE